MELLLENRTGHVEQPHIQLICSGGRQLALSRDCS